MSPISPYVAYPIGTFDSPAASGRAARATPPTPPEPSTKAAALAMRYGSASTLDIRTAEGDHVSISVKTLASMAAYAQSSGESASAGAGASVSTKIGVSVKGDLSDAELNDITHLIHALSAYKSAPADSADAFDAASLTSMPTLAAFDYAHRAHFEMHAGTAG